MMKLTRLVLLAGVIGMGTTGCSAASFDCARAATRTEKMICQHPDLSQADKALGDNYKLALKRSASAAALKREQQAWIAQVRNACADHACLVKTYAARNAALRESTVAAAASCPVNEQGLLSHWKRVQGGQFEQFKLSKDGATRSFTSWLHNRPEMNGTWSFQKCQLDIVNPDNPALDTSYKIVAMKKDVMVVEDMDEKSTASYQRVIP